jgi:hypothetical protein
MSFFDSSDSFASSGSDAFASGGTDAFASGGADNFANSSSSSFAEGGGDAFASADADPFASSGQSSNGFSNDYIGDRTNAIEESNNNNGMPYWLKSTSDLLASDGSGTDDVFSSSNKTGEFLGFLRKAFDAFASSSNVDDAFATGADDPFATDVTEKESAKNKAFYSTFSQLHVKNTYGNEPTANLSGVGHAKYGNKLGKKGIVI